jgi:UDP-glucose 4-epimerase
LAGARCLVTGAAGFIGSHLCERLLDARADVIGVDCFTDYYSPALKRRHLASVTGRPGFNLVDVDLARADLAPLLEGVDVIFHLAAQTGVRTSWGADFSLYLERNLLVTQRLVEAMIAVVPAARLVFSSSSSVYGDAKCLPTREETERRPVSPYGLTKVACEDLLGIYSAAYDLRWLALRYFTVYGPRQRPDMAFHRLLTAALTGGSFTIFGDGRQERDVTYVSDIVAATIAAGAAVDVSGECINIGAGRTVALSEVLTYVRSFAAPGFTLQYAKMERGDARATGASIDKARCLLAYTPQVEWREGIERQRREVEANLKDEG